MSRFDRLHSLPPVLDSPPCPTNRAVHRYFCRIPGGGVAEALIEHHADIAAERKLHIHRRFRRKHMWRPVEMRLKQHPVFRDLAQRIQTEDLKASRVASGSPSASP